MITQFFLPLVSVITAVSITSLASAADSVILKSGDSLSGNLIDSDASGTLTLSYPEAKQPIKIKESSVERILFDSSDSKNSTLTESIQLLNGDRFPCTITELNDKVVSFKSDSVGGHTITRDKVSQIRFNTKANKILYSGPGDDLSAWTTTSEDWKLKNGKLSVSKMSEAAKSISNLSENYILEFKTAWEEAAPRLHVFFSSDRRSADKKSSYYYINMDTHGITIHSYQKGNQKTLTQVIASDEIYGQSSLHVAIYVDRKNKKMALYLNGEFVKNLTDMRAPPKGSYLIIKNRQINGRITEVSDIKISSWAGKVSENIKSKSDTLSKHDLITDLSGSVMTGKILGLSLDGAGTSLHFKAPFSKKDSIIQGNAIDILEFKTTTTAPNLVDPIYQLNLVSGGLISFSSSQMINGKLTVEHPLLGKVSLPKTSLSSVVIIPQRPKDGEAEQKDANDKK